MDVGGAVGGGPAQHVVHDLDDGRIGGLGAELLDVHQLLDGGRGAHGEPEILAQRLVDALGRHHAAVRLVDGLLDGPAGADLEVHLEPGRPSQVIERNDIEWVGRGDDEPPPVALGGDDPVLARDFLGHELDDVEVEAQELLMSDRLLAELGAEVLEEDLLVEELHLDEDLAQAVAGLPLAAEGLGELLLGQDAVVDEHLSEGQPSPPLARLTHAVKAMQSSIAKSPGRRQLAVVGSPFAQRAATTSGPRARPRSGRAPKPSGGR